MELSLRLKCAREQAGLTQRQLAAKSGVGVKTISSFESSPTRTRSIKLAQLEAILAACGFTINSFFRWTPEASDGATDEPPVSEPPAAAPLAHHVRRPIDPLANFRRDDSPYPTPQSSLGGAV